ncbi:MAG: sigma-70 family RNA polymerase sigma factor [Firmicutes bacterium]|nr:sigma-70 family RNA polymerase sigma factor [Bacillota bacterium]
MAGKNQERDLELIRQVRAGDKKAREELVSKYVPMVKRIARNHYASFLEFEDLMQEGLIGLLSAIEEYDPEKNVKFSSFAYICILRKIYNVIKQTNGNKHKALNDAVSIHAFVNQEETRTILDYVPLDDSSVDPEEVVAERMVNQRLKTVLENHLSILEYTVISMFLEGYSSAEIEAAIGVNAKAVDNARTRVRLKLRRILTEHGSLLSPKVPLRVRRREDLYRKLPRLERRAE